MKRSEALALITDIISEVTYRPLAEKRAERILDALEKAGMSPPVVETVIHIPRMYETKEHDAVVYSRTWEPE